MGDIADMMLEGILCEGCGEYLDDEAPGYPRRCPTCSSSDQIRDIEDERILQHVDAALKPRRCPLCGKKCKNEHGIRQHMKDRHKALGNLLVFKLEPSDDEHLTCFFCGKTGVDHDFSYRQDTPAGARRFVTEGLHLACIPPLFGEPVEPDPED